jgi:hypothetical protein
MSITNTALAQAMSDLIAHWQDFQDEHQAWLAGTVGGGPNSDGKYPLTDYLDVTTLVTCPAQLESDVESLVAGAAGYSDDAEASATAAAASAATATTQAGLAATARTGAETAETNAETAQAAAESARNTAIAQAAAAAASATAAQTAETNAETAETNAETAQAAAEAAQAFAEAAADAAAASAIEAAAFDPDLFAGLSEDETITGNWSFTAAGAGDTSAAIRLASATPYIRYRESDQAADSTDWLLGSSTMVFHIGPVTDAGTSPQTAQGIHLTRSGATCTEIQLDATALDFNGTMDLSGAAVLNSTLQVLGVTELSAALPILRFQQTGGGSNAKNWLWYASADQLNLATATDASPGSAASSFLTFTRTGTTPGNIFFGGSSILRGNNTSGTAYGSGTATGNGATLHVFGSSHATAPGYAYMDANYMTFRTIAGTTRFAIDTSGNFNFMGGQVTTSGLDSREVGFVGTPVNKNGASPAINGTGGSGHGSFTLNSSHAGGTIAVAHGATITIDTHANMPIPIGTVIRLFGYQTSGGASIAQGSGVTLYWAGTDFTTGNRTCSGGHWTATLTKIDTNIWSITGVGLS